MLLPEQALLIGFALVGLFGGRRRKLAALLIGWLVPCGGAACRAVGAGAWNPGPSGHLPIPFVLAKRVLNWKNLHEIGKKSLIKEQWTFSGHVGLGGT